jgi:hypothetical protein
MGLLSPPALPFAAVTWRLPAIGAECFPTAAGRATVTEQDASAATLADTLRSRFGESELRLGPTTEWSAVIGSREFENRVCRIDGLEQMTPVRRPLQSREAREISIFDLGLSTFGLRPLAERQGDSALLRLSAGC